MNFKKFPPKSNIAPETRGGGAGYPLILTGSINSKSYYGESLNVGRRLSKYENAISRYITETKFNPIVFCENSDYPFDDLKFKNLARKYGKTFEFIKGTECSKEVKEHGAGYGDSLLIYEALTNSESLKDAEFFYKITGRIFLKNSDKIIKSAKIHRNEFISYDGLGWVMTYIFKANKDDYLNVLADVYLETDYIKLLDMEICFWKRLYSSSLDIGCFKTYPVIIGNMGESDTPYTKSKLDTFLRNIGVKAGVFTMKSKSGAVFWKLYKKLTGRKSYVEN